MKYFLTALLVGFLGLCAWASYTSSFVEAIHIMNQLPWGVVTIVDLYLGFLAFSLLIFHLEKSWKKATGLFGLMCVLGNPVALGYLIYFLSKQKKGNI